MLRLRSFVAGRVIQLATSLLMPSRAHGLVWKITQEDAELVEDDARKGGQNLVDLVRVLDDQRREDARSVNSE